jgi:hypothetical protein
MDPLNSASWNSLRPNKPNLFILTAPPQWRDLRDGADDEFDLLYSPR